MKNETKQLRFIATLEMTAYLTWIGGELAGRSLSVVEVPPIPLPFHSKCAVNSTKGRNLIIHEHFIFRDLKLFWGNKRISIKNNKSFAVKTTLSIKIYARKIRHAKENGYRLTLLLFLLKSVNSTQFRVQESVIEGGLNIPNEVIERRYSAGIRNLFNIHLPLFDQAWIFDNSNRAHELVAEFQDNEFNLFNKEVDTHLKSKL